MLAADWVVFTNHTVGMVGTNGGYAVSKDDFVKEEAAAEAAEGGEG